MFFGISPSVCPRPTRRSACGTAALLGLLLTLTVSGADNPVGDADIFTATRKAVAENRLTQTRVIGHDSGAKLFRDNAPSGGVLVGFEVGVAKFVSRTWVGTLQPIYLTAQGESFGQKHGGQKQLPRAKDMRRVIVKARPGYAVNGLLVRAATVGGSMVEGLALQCARIKGDHFDVTDHYTTEWVGNPTNKVEATLLDAGGAPVIGINGYATERACTGLGLVHVRIEAAPVPDAVKPPPTKPAVKPTQPAPPPTQPVAAITPAATGSTDSDGPNYPVLIAVFGGVTAVVFALMYVLMRRKETTEGAAPPETDEEETEEATGAAEEATGATEDAGTGIRSSLPTRSAVPSFRDERPAESVKRRASEVSEPVLGPGQRVGFGTRIAAFAFDIMATVVVGVSFGCVCGSFVGVGVAGKYMPQMMAEIEARQQNSGNPNQKVDKRAAKNFLTGYGAGFGAQVGLFAGVLIGIPVVQMIFMLFEGLTGMAFGKWKYGIRVQAVDGRTPSTGALMLRALTKYSPTWLYVLALLISLPFMPAPFQLFSFGLIVLSWFAMFIVILGCFAVLSETRQALHDMPARTAVFDNLAVMNATMQMQLDAASQKSGAAGEFDWAKSYRPGQL